MSECDEFKAAFIYDPLTGTVTRVGARRRVDLGPAGFINDRGYVRIKHRQRSVYGHRLAWILTHGSIPDGYEIDHINGDKADNRISNLRLALRTGNGRNRQVNASSATGLKGVQYDAERGRYRYKIMMNGRVERRGSFDTAEEAARAYDQAALRLHGKFARLNYPEVSVHDAVHGD